MNIFETPDIQVASLSIVDITVTSNNEFDIVPFSNEDELGIAKLG